MARPSSLFLIGVLALAGGCGESAEARELRKELGEGWEATKTWSRATWDRFVGDAQRRLEGLEVELRELEDRARRGGDAAAERLRALESDLRQRLDALRRELTEADGVDESVRPDTSRTVERELQDITRELEDARRAIDDGR